MKKIAAVLALAVLAGTAAAQTVGTIRFQVSNDGSTWGSSTTVNQNGLVWVRGLVSHNHTYLAFASVTLEDIRFTGTNATDVFALTEITNGSNWNELHVGNTVGNFARRFAPSASGVPALTLIGAGTGLVRIDNAVNPDTTGRVLAGQSTFAIPGGPFYQGLDTSNPISVFGYVFQAGTGVGRVINVGGTITVAGNPLLPQFRFFINAAGSNEIPSMVESIGASVEIIPAPASLALLGLGGLIAGRRRR
jgi:hypothetical protein